MMKDERIAQLERLVSDLSRRVRDLEARPRYVYYPQYPQPTYPYILCSSGMSQTVSGGTTINASGRTT